MIQPQSSLIFTLYEEMGDSMDIWKSSLNNSDDEISFYFEFLD